ncbi:MAG TPA: alpha-hydroxy acid oxidase, partial [Candidatus Udaeobacter sp.]
MFPFAQRNKARSVAPPRVINIEDLRRIAKRQLPRVVFDYIDGGAEDERTLRANCRAFEEVTFRPRCAVATPPCDLRVSVLGQSLSMPLILAPVGSSRIMYPRGEEAAASAAGAAGIAYTLSTLSGCRMEDVAAASKGPVWYQLYLVGGRDCALAAIERAKSAGFSALVVTIDTAVAGMRERDLRNGVKELLADRFGSRLPFASQLLTKPGWLCRFLADGGLMKFENVV